MRTGRGSGAIRDWKRAKRRRRKEEATEPGLVTSATYRSPGIFTGDLEE
jgi:hypothetical protein